MTRQISFFRTRAALLVTLASILAGATGFSSYAFAQQTYYITDDLFVPLRSGPGNEFRILHSRLRSGLTMTILDMPEGDWAQVRTPAGLEGWMRKQYLSDTPTAKILLEKANKTLGTTQQQSSELQTQFDKLNADYTRLDKAHKQLSNAHQQLTETHLKLKTLSEDAVNLSQRYQDLLEKHELLLTEFDAVRAENDRLENSNTINQWLTGAGLLILGMLVTIIGPALKPRSKHSEWV